MRASRRLVARAAARHDVSAALASLTVKVAAIAAQQSATAPMNATSGFSSIERAWSPSHATDARPVAGFGRDVEDGSW